MDSKNSGSILSDLNDDTSIRDSNILKTIGPIPELEFDDFIGRVFSEDQTSSRIIDFPDREALVRNGIYTTDNHWSLLQRCPSECKMDEKDYFTSLSRLFQDIIGLLKVRARYDKPKTSVQPNVGIVCEHIERSRHKRAFTTCHVKYKEPRCHPACDYLDVITLGHVALVDNAENRTNNYLNTLKSYVNLMGKDLSRRFVFAYTVEDTQMRWWHFSRIGILVSKPFNWFTDTKRLVRVFTLLAIASPKQLGISPVISPVKIGNDIRFEFMLRSGTYVSTGTVLSDHRAWCFFGEATRVITVKKKDVEDAPEVALKYYWTQEGKRQLEGDKLNMLRWLAEEQGMDPNMFLLKPLDHGVFEWKEMDRMKEGKIKVQDTSERFIGESYYRPGSYLLYRPESASFKSIGAADINALLQEEHYKVYSFFEEPKFQPYKFKLQHRKQVYVLFEEIGIALHNLTYLPNMFLALRDAIKALYCLHQLGFVHQDISTGNFIVYKGTTKILDLEYLSPLYPNPLYDEPELEVKFTMPFVSTEVFDKSYKYRPDIGKDLNTYPVEKHDKSKSGSREWLKWPHFIVPKSSEKASIKLQNYISYLKMNNVEAIKSSESDEEDEENGDEDVGVGENESELEDKDEDGKEIKSGSEDKNEEKAKNESGDQDKVAEDGEGECRSSDKDIIVRRQESASQKTYKKSQMLRLKHHVPLRFRCNAAHDLEGCNWILLWTFFQHVPEDGVYDYEEDSGPYNQLKEAQDLFPNYCKSVYILRALMLQNERLFHNTWYKSLPTQYSAARDAVGVTFRILYAMHRSMQKYNPILPEPRFHYYSSLIWFYNYLATLPELQFRIKFLSQYKGKAESPLETEYCPKVESVDDSDNDEKKKKDIPTTSSSV